MAGELKMDIKEKLIELLDGMFNGECCVDKIEAADFLIAHGVTVQEWISVNDERKPKEGEDVLVAVFDGYDTYTNIDCLMRDGKWCFETENYKVTHWMEKPEPPKGE